LFVIKGHKVIGSYTACYARVRVLRVSVLAAVKHLYIYTDIFIVILGYIPLV